MGGWEGEKKRKNWLVLRQGGVGRERAGEVLRNVEWFSRRNKESKKDKASYDFDKGHIIPNTGLLPMSQPPNTWDEQSHTSNNYTYIIFIL